VRERFEYWIVWLWVKLVGLLPRSLARAKCITLSLLVYLAHRRLRHVGMRNLEIAFPQIGRRERRRILRGVYISLGRQLAEFCLFPRYTRENVGRVVIYDGFENYERALFLGKGVLFLTAHLGAWELSAFAHSLQGHPLSIVMRSLDNAYVDRLVQSYRTMHGNRAIDKADSARDLLSAMRAGEVVGILMDTNMTPPEGVFVEFFGTPAYTTNGLARIALRTGAAVVPGFTIWNSTLRKYTLHFDPAVELIHTGDDQADVVANTAQFTKTIEAYVRRYPDQWLWVHRRWKTRPEGERGLY
jgi:KDO2-lipid IV(A) lauroyltransferase